MNKTFRLLRILLALMAFAPLVLPAQADTGAVNTVTQQASDLDPLSVLPAQADKEPDYVVFIKDARANFNNRSIDLYVQVEKGGHAYRGATLEATQLSASELNGEQRTALEIAAIRELKADTFCNYIIETRSPSPFYIGAPDRSIELKVFPEQDTARALVSLEKIGNLSSPLQFGSQRRSGAWTTGERLLLGLLTLALLLLLLSEAPPLVRWAGFRTQHVKPYRLLRVEGKSEADPVTLQRFEDNDLVVTKCKQKSLLSIWKSRGYRCPNYPDCPLVSQGCHGRGFLADPPRLFFTQQGSYRISNWLWFAALGGMLGWLLFTLFRIGGWMEGLGLRNLLYDSFLGLAIGLAMGFMLSYVEARGDIHDISWKKVLFRSLGAGGMAALMFTLGYLLQIALSMGLLASGLITWLLFGTGLGFVMSLGSSISWQRGLLGGAIAGPMAFGVYFWLIGHYQNSELALMFSLILMGCILGVVLVTVTKELDDYNLEVLSPTSFSGRKVSISKWLNANLRIAIGSDQGCHVLVKWEDPYASPRHAELERRQQSVFLTPLAETWVDGRSLPLNQPYALRNGDIIRLGRDSVSRIQYQEKRKS